MSVNGYKNHETYQIAAEFFADLDTDDFLDLYQDANTCEEYVRGELEDENAHQITQDLVRVYLNKVDWEEIYNGFADEADEEE